MKMKAYKNNIIICLLIFSFLFTGSPAFAMSVTDLEGIINIVENAWVVKVADVVLKWAKENFKKSREDSEMIMERELKPRYLLYNSIMERGWGVGKGSSIEWETGITHTNFLKVAFISPDFRFGLGTQLIRNVVGENNREYLGFSGILPVYAYFMPFCNIKKRLVRFLKDDKYEYVFKSTVKPTYLYFGASRWVNTNMIDFGICHYVLPYINLKIGYMNSYYPRDDIRIKNLYMTTNFVIGAGWKAIY